MVKKFSQKSDLQSDSNKLSGSEGQLELLPSARPNAEPIDQSLIIRQRDMDAAINLCVQASGLIDKQVYDRLDIDAATFSKIKNRQAYFPACRLDSLLDICGNDAPLRWWATKRGYELVPMRSDLERQLAAERAARIEAERKLEIVTQFVKETR